MRVPPALVPFMGLPEDLHVWHACSGWRLVADPKILVFWLAGWLVKRQLYSQMHIEVTSQLASAFPPPQIWREKTWPQQKDSELEQRFLFSQIHSGRSPRQQRVPVCGGFKRTQVNNVAKQKRSL